MNGSLFASMLKTNAKSIFSYAFGLALYLLMTISIYPSMAGSGALNELIQQMPQNYLSAFGLESGIQDLTVFMSSEYYGIIFILILMIYCVMTATQLVSRLVDRGSMAYLLSTPSSRTKIAVTQASVLLLGLVMITLFTTIVGLVGTDLIIDDADLNVSTFIQMNVVGFLLFFVVSGYSFFFSCLFNDEKRALSVSSILSVAFFAINLIAKMGPDLDWMKYFTLLSTFQPADISRGTVDILPISISLAVSGFLLYFFAVVIFKKRDLPL